MNDSVEVITQHRPQSFIDSWYELADESHPWFRWRLAASLNQLRELNVSLQQNLKGLEVGCGTGVLRSQLESATNWTVDGADLDFEALQRCGPARGRTLFYDIREEAFEFIEAYDVLVLYDVLEHIPEPASFIASLLCHLKPGGLLLVNVPAVPLLYSYYDRAVGHVRRYDKKMLGREFQDFDVEIIDLRYWGFSLVPVLLLRSLRLGLKPSASSDDITRRGFKSPHSLTDKFAGVIMRAEARVLRRPPLGSSLLMVARKGTSK